MLEIASSSRVTISLGSSFSAIIGIAYSNGGRVQRKGYLFWVKFKKLVWIIRDNSVEIQVQVLKELLE